MENRFLKLCCVLLLICVRTELSAQDSGPELSEPSTKEMDLPQQETIKSLSTLPPEESSKLYWKLRDKFRSNRAISDQVRNSYLQNPKIRAWLTDTIKKLPHSHFNSFTRSHYLGLLSGIKKKWVVELLGDYLENPLEFSDPQMTNEEIVNIIINSDSIHIFSNQSISARIITSLEIEGAPFEEMPFGGYSENDIEKWREWWINIKGNLNKISFSDPQFDTDGTSLILPGAEEPGMSDDAEGLKGDEPVAMRNEPVGSDVSKGHAGPVIETPDEVSSGRTMTLRVIMLISGILLCIFVARIIRGYLSKSR